MRVAHIVNSLTKASGVSVFCANMTQHLAELEWDIDLYVWWVGDDALIPDHERITVYETKDKGFNPLIKPDIVHIHSLWNPIMHSGCVYARKNNIPYIISPHGMLTPWALRHSWWKKLLGLLLYQYHDLNQANLLHATAESEVEDIRRLQLRQDVAIVPLGTELPLVNSTDSNPVDLNYQRYFPLDSSGGKYRTVLFLSRVHPKKGLANLFQAWADIKHNEIKPHEHDQSTQNISWRLVIAGPNDSGHKEELLRLGQSLELRIQDLSQNFQLLFLNQLEQDTDIVFTGPVYGDDKNRLHQIADLFVLPSHSENFAVVVPDSLAYGVPVITTKGTPWAELEGHKAVESDQGKRVESKSDQMSDSISNGRCGWWIDVGIEPLVDALREAIGLTDEERQEIGQNGRRLVESKYTWPVMADEMSKAYKRMLVAENDCG